MALIVDANKDRLISLSKTHRWSLPAPFRFASGSDKRFGMSTECLSARRTNVSVFTNENVTVLSGYRPSGDLHSHGTTFRVYINHCIRGGKMVFKILTSYDNIYRNVISNCQFTHWPKITCKEGLRGA